jgi:threonine dehydrogenase-like Zn-dependent dehydrogenase
MDGLMPTMKSGDILGHEFMGEVIETGSAHSKFRKGDRIVVPFNINCGECRQCKLGNYSVCQRSNRNAAMAAAQFGYTTAGLFGYSHLTGGYAGDEAGRAISRAWFGTLVGFSAPLPVQLAVGAHTCLLSALAELPQRKEEVLTTAALIGLGPRCLTGCGRRADWVRRKQQRFVYIDFRPGVEPRQREQRTGESRRGLYPSPLPSSLRPVT